MLEASRVPFVWDDIVRDEAGWRRLPHEVNVRVNAIRTVVMTSMVLLVMVGWRSG